MGIIRGSIRSSKKLAMAAGLLLLGLAVACGSSSSSNGGGDASSKLVPQRATVVGSLASDQALEAINLNVDQFLDMLSSQSGGQGEKLDEFLTVEQFQPGGLFGNITRVDVFGEVTDGDDLGYLGAVLHGSFDEPAFIATLEEVSGEKLAKKTYKDQNVYSPVDSEEEFDLSVLNDSLFALGTGGAINDIIDIKVGDAASASGPLIDTFDSLADGLFALAVKVPENFGEDSDLGEVPGLGDLPISLDFMSSLNIIGLNGTLDGTALDVKVTLDFSDEEAAESLEGFVSGLVSLASGFVADPETAGLLESLDVERDASLLTVKVSIPLADIPGLFGDFTSVSSVESSTDGALQPGTPEIRLLPAAVGVEVPILGADHVNEGVRVEYNSTPPTSGKHWPRWADCGFYTESLPDERIVHNLEHGNIVVSYNFTNPAQVTELRAVLEDVPEFTNWGIARSYDDIPDGQVAIAAWGRLNVMDGVRPGEIRLFFESVAGILGPERVTC